MQTPLGAQRRPENSRMARAQKAAPVDLRQQLLEAIYAGQAFHRVLRDLSLTSNQVRWSPSAHPSPRARRSSRIQSWAARRSAARMKTGIVVSSTAGGAFATKSSIAAVSARSGDGSPRLCMSPSDSILTRPRESTPHFRAELCRELVVVVRIDIHFAELEDLAKVPAILRPSDESLLVERRLSPVVWSNRQAELDNRNRHTHSNWSKPANPCRANRLVRWPSKPRCSITTASLPPLTMPLASSRLLRHGWQRSSVASAVTRVGPRHGAVRRQRCLRGARRSRDLVAGTATAGSR
jgi:hypothetical protein